MDPHVSEATALKPSELHENAALAGAKTGGRNRWKICTRRSYTRRCGTWSTQECAEGPGVSVRPRDSIEVVLGGKSFSALYDPGAQVPFVDPKITKYYEKRLFKKKDMLEEAVVKGVHKR
ncbi:hypothetical protein QAD02_021272 [Eretmocerus hayati]|uniref:Uncharacterized protein n=1 Tax=Eretmocerus hayati TaxID=131215 RepID=A0ACC2PPF9_9HYME|nr:hypothetical protein QAD02_021272 [Eretmocerus hayati]